MTSFDNKSKQEDKDPIDEIGSHSSLSELQDYFRCVASRRGFDDETPHEIILLMMEELGELAEAFRKEAGMKVDAEDVGNYPRLEEEMADIFLYLLHLANTCESDLYEAFEEKERENSSREWVTHNTTDQ